MTPVQRVSSFNSVAMLAMTAALSAAAGLVVVRGSIAGHVVEAALIPLAVLALLLAWKDERVAIALFGLSFLAVPRPWMRVDLAGLWVPAPAVIGAVILARELVRRSAGAESWRNEVPWTPLALLFVGFLASGFSVVSPALYGEALVKWSAHVLVFAALVWSLRERRWIFALADGLSFAVTVLAAYGLYRVFSGLSPDIDVFQGIATRSAAALYITAIIPLVYARLASASGVSWLARLTALGTLMTAQIFTYTRAGWIASTLGLLLASGRRPRAYLMIALAAGLLVLTVPQSVRNRFLSIFIVADYGVDPQFASSTPLRERLLETGLLMAADNWATGVGLGNYEANYHRYAVPGAPLDANTPHDSFVLLWAEAGVLALGAFLWLYASRLWMLWTALPQASGETRDTLLGLAAGLMAMAAESCLEDDLNVILMWTLLGMATALALSVRRRGR